jgi:hypothetical protein
MQPPASAQQLSQSYPQHVIPQSPQTSVSFQSTAPQAMAQSVHPAQKPKLSQCESCKSGAELYQFCDHRMCPNCISTSAFTLKCQVCAKPQDFSANPKAFDEFYGTVCNGCGEKKITIDYCTHKVCKDCIMMIKQGTACFICDTPMALGFHNQLLSLMMVSCRQCTSLTSGVDAFYFDCSCTVCFTCTASSPSLDICKTCGKRRTRFDQEQLRPFYQG